MKNSSLNKNVSNKKETKKLIKAVSIIKILNLISGIRMIIKKLFMNLNEAKHIKMLKVNAEKNETINNLFEKMLFLYGKPFEKIIECVKYWYMEK